MLKPLKSVTFAFSPMTQSKADNRSMKQGIGLIDFVLIFFLIAVYLVPESVSYFGPFRGKNPFYVIFGLIGLFFLVEKLLNADAIYWNSPSEIIYILFITFAIPYGLMMIKLGEGYHLLNFLFGNASFLTSTFFIYLTIISAKNINYRLIIKLIIALGVFVGLMIFVESFILQGSSIYEILFGYNPFLENLREENPDLVKPREYIRHVSDLELFRCAGPFRNPLVAGFFLLLPLALALSRIKFPLTWSSFFYGLCALLIFAGIIGTVSVSFVVCAGLMIYLYFILYRRFIAKPLLLMLLVILPLPLIIVYILVYSPVNIILMEIQTYLTEGYYANMTLSLDRADFIIRGFNVWFSRPLGIMLLGTGFGQMLYDKWSFKIPYDLLDDFGMYMAMLLEVGLIGLLVFILFFVLEIMSGLRNAKNSNSIEEKCFYIAYSSYIIALLVEFWIYIYYANLYIFAIFFALKTIIARECKVPKRGHQPSLNYRH